MDNEYIKDGGRAAIAPDGWKSIVAFMNSPPNVINLYRFGVVFVKVVTATGNIKSATWICDSGMPIELE